MVNFNDFLAKHPDFFGLEISFEADSKFPIQKDNELDRYFTFARFKLTVWSDENDMGEHVTLGYLNLVKIPSNFRFSPSLEKGYDMYNAMEESDLCDLPEVKNVVLNPYIDRLLGITDALQKSDLYHISEIFIYPQYRRNRLGEKLLSLMPELIKNYFGDEDGLVSLRINPIDVPDGVTRPQAYKMLEDFYTRNGFQIFNSDIGLKRF